MSWQLLFPDGFWQNQQVVNALQVGALAALLSAVLGYFVVLRGLSFAGHAITDIGLAGAAGSLLVGLAPFWGLLSFSVSAAAGVELLGERARERDVATGILLSLAVGLGSFFLSISNHAANTPYVLLFGSIFEADATATPLLCLVGLLVLVAVAFLYRPLLFASLSPETAAARGVRVRLISVAFIIVVAIGVSIAAQVVGVLLSTALLVGPAATAAYLVARPGWSMLLACLIAVVETWLGILLSYDSYYWTWPVAGKGWPVSFFITALALGSYLLMRWWRPAAHRS